MGSVTTKSKATLWLLVLLAASAVLFLFTWTPPSVSISLTDSNDVTNPRTSKNRNEKTIESGRIFSTAPRPSLSTVASQAVAHKPSESTPRPEQTHLNGDSNGEKVRETSDREHRDDDNSSLDKNEDNMSTSMNQNTSVAYEHKCSFKWYEQQFDSWKRLPREVLRGGGGGGGRTLNSSGDQAVVVSSTSSGTDRTPSSPPQSICATLSLPALSPNQPKDGCDWVLATEETAKRRQSLEIKNMLLYPSRENEGSNQTFLRPHVLSSSLPSVRIWTSLSEGVETIRVKRRRVDQGQIPQLKDDIDEKRETTAEQLDGESHGGHCTLPHVDPPRCSQETSVLFIGHSHTRFLASMHCMMTRGTACHRYDRHSNDYVLVTGDEGSEVLLPLVHEKEEGDEKGMGGGGAGIRVMPAGERLIGTARETSAGPLHEEREGGFILNPIRSLYIQANLDVRHRLKFVRAALEDYIERVEKKYEHEFKDGGKADVGEGKQGGELPKPKISAQKAAVRNYFEQALRNATVFGSLFTHIVLSKGAWEALSYDRKPNATSQELVVSLQALAEIFPRAKIVVQLLHGYIPNKDTAGKKKKLSKPRKARQWWRNLCFSHERLEKLRLATLCGVERYLMEIEYAQEGGGKGSSETDNVNEEESRGRVHSKNQKRGVANPQIEIFDTIEETLDPYGSSYADGLGHHFTDGALEAMVQKLLYNHICPSSQTSHRYNSTISEEGKEERAEPRKARQLQPQQLAMIRQYILTNVPSVDPANIVAFPTSSKRFRRYPTIFEAYSQTMEAKRAERGGGLSNAREGQSFVCPLVDKMSREHVLEPKCACLRDKLVSDGFCASMMGNRAEMIARLGGQKDNLDD